ncbi:MAG: hypothetical protein JW818_22790, partial [Pirellulales bacterium]|nr:hypothetical protein [Pirellulales bacterium]
VMQTPKPFADYKRPSGYSPYMSLFRYNDAGRGINNYYNSVLPQLDQQRQNMLDAREIRQLGDVARYDYQSIQQSKQRPGNAVRTENRQPATFMNYQQYFGGGR